VAGRPLVAATLALNYALGGLDPWGYHAFNLAVLWASALTLFALVRRVLRLPSIPPALRDRADVLALCVAAIWLVHPLQTELVNYAVQRSEALAGLFLLVTMYASLRLMSGRRPVAWTTVAVLACALGMATKESMVIAPVLVLVFDSIFLSGSPARALRGRPALYVGLAATWIVLIALNAGGPRSNSAGFSSGVSAWTYLLNQGPIIATYLTLSVWPHPLIADYGLTPPITLAEAAPACILIAALVLLTVIALWKWPKAGFLGAWFFITLAPASSIVPIATEVGAERRMYLPLAALAALAVGSAVMIAARRGVPAAWTTRGVLAGTAVAVATLAFVTVHRNADYRDHVLLWEQVIRERPTARAHYSLGLELKASGQIERALDEYRQAAALGDFEALYALGFEHDAQGRSADAIRYYRQFIDRAGEDYRVPLAYVLLGRALEKQQRFTDAEAAFRQVFTMQPRNADAHGGLADVLLAENRFAEAAAAYRTYLQLSPGNAAAYGNLGRALVGMDRVPDAAQAFEQAVTIVPRNPDARMNLGLALASLGRLDEAIVQYRAGLQIAPNSASLHSALGAALAAQGRRDEAAAEFNRAMALDPDNPKVRADIEAASGRSVGAQRW
jgi:tetratricopeptide (TPR) repeat protein